ncbi:hypothetical protein IAT38_001540 [Cryptococcus sp. DSM 104549]
MALPPPPPSLPSRPPFTHHRGHGPHRGFQGGRRGRRQSSGPYPPFRHHKSGSGGDSQRRYASDSFGSGRNGMSLRDRIDLAPPITEHVATTEDRRVVASSSAPIHTAERGQATRQGAEHDGHEAGRDVTGPGVPPVTVNHMPFEGGESCPPTPPLPPRAESLVPTELLEVAEGHPIATDICSTPSRPLTPPLPSRVESQVPEAEGHPLANGITSSESRPLTPPLVLHAESLVPAGLLEAAEGHPVAMGTCSTPLSHPSTPRSPTPPSPPPTHARTRTPLFFSRSRSATPQPPVTTGKVPLFDPHPNERLSSTPTCLLAPTPSFSPPVTSCRSNSRHITPSSPSSCVDDLTSYQPSTGGFGGIANNDVLSFLTSTESHLLTPPTPPLPVLGSPSGHPSLELEQALESSLASHFDRLEVDQDHLWSGARSSSLSFPPGALERFGVESGGAGYCEDADMVDELEGVECGSEEETKAQLSASGPYPSVISPPSLFSPTAGLVPKPTEFRDIHADPLTLLKLPLVKVEVVDDEATVQSPYMRHLSAVSADNSDYPTNLTSSPSPFWGRSPSKSEHTRQSPTPQQAPAYAINSSIELFDTTDTKKRLGIRACTFIPRGSLILKEHPFLTIPDTSGEIEWEHVAEGLCGHPHSIQARLEGLGAGMDLPENEEERLTAIARMYALPLEGFETLGMFENMCRVNHSCVPNAGWTWYEDEKALHLYAFTDISPGEEVTASYLDDTQLLLCASSRTSKLRRFGFTCHCTACTAPLSQIKEDDEALARTRIALAAINGCGLGAFVDMHSEGFDSINILGNLIAELGDKGRVSPQRELYDHLVDLCAMFGLADNVHEAASAAYDHCQMVVGVKKARDSMFMKLMVDAQQHPDWGVLAGSAEVGIGKKQKQKRIAVPSWDKDGDEDYCPSDE